MKTSWLTVCLGVALIAGTGGPAWPAGPAGDTTRPAATTALPSQSPGERIRGLIARVAAAQRALTTLRAHFRETKTGTLFLHPVVSAGTFSFRAPDFARWDYTGPHPMVVVFAHDQLITIDPSTGGVQKLRVRQRQRRLVKFLTGTQPLDRLIANFMVSLSDPAPDKPYVLKLEPEGPAVRRKLRRITIGIDKRLNLPVHLELVGGNGDTTVYDLSQIEINPKLDPELFTVTIPRKNGGRKRGPGSGRRH